LLNNNETINNELQSMTMYDNKHEAT